MARLSWWPVIYFLATVSNASGQSQAGSTFKVPLHKQNVPVVMKGKQVAVKTAYYGDIHVGGPTAQSFTVVFDTGSGHLFIPSSSCKDKTCLAHKQFHRQLSGTALDMNFNGPATEELRDQVALTYGTGEVVGEIVQDTVCIGELPSMRAGLTNRSKCATVNVVTASKMSNEPFLYFKFDGVLGLGLPTLALEPQFHFFGMMAKQRHIEPVFGCFLSKSDDVQSELTFGGYDGERISTPMRYAPVKDPADGYWRVQIRSARVGNTSIAECDNGGCTAIVDTGTSLLGVPSETLSSYVSLTAREVHIDTTDCRHTPGPPIVFDLGDFDIRLDAEEYSRPVPSAILQPNSSSANVSHAICRAQLLPVSMPQLGKHVFLWGAPVLRKYYTTYDLNRERVGFALASHQQIPKSESGFAQGESSSQHQLRGAPVVV